MLFLVRSEELGVRSGGGGAIKFGSAASFYMAVEVPAASPLSLKGGQGG